MPAVRNLILCIAVPVLVVMYLERHPQMIDQALSVLPVEHTRIAYAS